MGTKNHAQEEAIRRAVRNAIAVDPLVSSRALAKAVKEKTGLPVTKEYVLKQMKKARREAITEVESAKVVPEIAKISEHFRVMIDRLNKIVFAEDGAHKDSDIIAAAAQILKTQHDLFYMMLDAGIFKKPPVVVEHKVEITPEIQQILDNAKNWGFTGAADHGPDVIMPDAEKC